VHLAADVMIGFALIPVGLACSIAAARSTAKGHTFADRLSG
jgi:hypothetical protein